MWNKIKCFNKYNIDELQKMKTSILIEKMHKIGIALK